MPRKTVKKQTLPVEPEPVDETLMVQEEPDRGPAVRGRCRTAGSSAQPTSPKGHIRFGALGWQRGAGR